MSRSSCGPIHVLHSLCCHSREPTGCELGVWVDLSRITVSLERCQGSFRRLVRAKLVNRHQRMPLWLLLGNTYLERCLRHDLDDVKSVAYSSLSVHIHIGGGVVIEQSVSWGYIAHLDAIYVPAKKVRKPPALYRSRTASVIGLPAWRKEAKPLPFLTTSIAASVLALVLTRR